MIRKRKCPMEKQEGKLRRELSFLEAIALSIGIMAPTAAMALNGSLAAGITGSGVPLAFLLATIAVGLASFSFIQFSRYFAHSGSVYGFNGIALGPRVGFFSGWALLGTYLAFTCASTAEVGNFAEAFFAGLHVSIDWLPLAIVAGVIIWLFAYSAITLSTRLTLLMEGISVLLIAILTIVIFAKVGSAGQLTAQPFTPGNQPLNNVGLAAVFGFLSFAGFEGAATLGEETRNPRRNIPIAILTAVSPTMAVAIVMIITFAIVLGWSRAPGINGASLFGFLGTIGVFLILVAYILTNVGAIRFFVARQLWTWQWIIPVAAILVLGYTLYSNLYPVPAAPYNIFPYVALAWLVIGLVIVFVSPALVRRIGLHLEESEGLHLEEKAGPVS
jgi:amino acid transporter